MTAERIEDPREMLLEMRLDLAKKIGSLVQDERWQALVERVRSFQRNAFARLVGGELSPYQQGYWQGFFSALVVFSQSAKDNEKQIAQLESEVSKTAHRNELTKLLDGNRLPQDVMDELLEAAGFATKED